MFDAILERLYLLNGCSTEADKRNYLEGLKPAAEALWTIYRDPQVNAAYYARDTQAAYMLRYFPQHVELFRRVLFELSESVSLPFDRRILYTRHFACGPAPELCGLVQFLQNRFPACGEVSAHLYDTANDDWAYARRITTEYVAPALCDELRVKTREAQFDFTTTDITATSRGLESIRKADLITFQNCLNEIPTTRGNLAVENIVSLLAAMKPGGVLLLIDRLGYKHVLKLLRNIYTLAEEQHLGQIVVSPEREREYDTRPLLNQMPPVLTDYLFIRYQRGMVCDRQMPLMLANRLRYYCLVIQRS